MNLFKINNPLTKMLGDELTELNKSMDRVIKIARTGLKDNEELIL